MINSSSSYFKINGITYEKFVDIKSEKKYKLGNSEYIQKVVAVVVVKQFNYSQQILALKENKKKVNCNENLIDL